MLPDVLASHSQNGSSDMGYVSSSEAQLLNTADPPKSTVATPGGGMPARVGRPQISAAVLICLALTAGGPAGAAQNPPVSAPQENQASGASVSQVPVGTMSELMVKIIYPTSDAVFYITTRTPQDAVGWADLEGKTLMLAEAGNLLMLPAHRRDDDRWLTDARLMRDAGAAAYKAAKARDVKALEDVNESLYQSCVTCHQHYRRNYGRGR